MQFILGLQADQKEKLLDKANFDVHFDGSNLAGMTSDDRSVIWYEFRLK